MAELPRYEDPARVGSQPEDEFSFPARNVRASRGVRLPTGPRLPNMAQRGMLIPIVLVVAAMVVAGFLLTTFVFGGADAPETTTAPQVTGPIVTPTPVAALPTPPPGCDSYEDGSARCADGTSAPAGTYRAEER